MDNAVLFVGDDTNGLNALARLFLNRDVRVLRAGNGAGPEHHLRHRKEAQRGDHGAERTRKGDRLHRADPRGGGGVTMGEPTRCKILIGREEPADG